MADDPTPPDDRRPDSEPDAPPPAMADAGRAQDAEQAEPVDQLSPYYRERNLAAEGAEAPPMALWVTIFGVVLFSVYYLGAYSGDFSTYPWLQNPGTAPATAAAPVAVSGEQVYQSRCSNCHQADGAGLPGAFPPLAGAGWVTGDEGVLIRILLQGMEGPVVVKGAEYDGVMPGWSQLSDEEIAAVTTHERTSWGNDASPISPEQVAAVRELTSGRSKAWTADELAEPANQGVPVVQATSEDGAGPADDAASPDDPALQTDSTEAGPVASR
jgi:mono/diheme cytochrome c family protein